MKRHDQGNWARKGFIWFALLHHTSTLQEVRIGTWTDADAMDGVLLTGLLNLACLPWFFIEPRISTPGIALPTVAVALPNQSLNEKMFYRFAYNQIQWELFLNQCFHHSNDNTLYQVTLSLARTTPLSVLEIQTSHETSHPEFWSWVFKSPTDSTNSSTKSVLVD